MRRVMNQVVIVERSKVLHTTWYAWCSLVPLAFSPGLVPSRCSSRGWLAKARYADGKASKHRLAIMRTSIFLFLGGFRPVVAIMVMRDRFDFLHRKAYEAQCAALNGDARATFSIVKMLAGRSTASTSRCVKLKNATMANYEEERDNSGGRSTSATCSMV